MRIIEDNSNPSSCCFALYCYPNSSFFLRPPVLSKLFSSLRSFRLRLPWPFADRVSLAYCCRRYIEGVGSVLLTKSVFNFEEEDGAPAHWRVHPNFTIPPGCELLHVDSCTLFAPDAKDPENRCTMTRYQKIQDPLIPSGTNILSTMVQNQFIRRGVSISIR